MTLRVAFVAETPTFASIMPVTTKRRGHGMGDGLLNCRVGGRHDGPQPMRPPLVGGGRPSLREVVTSELYACVLR